MIPPNIRKLVGILGMLGSEHGGERAAAGLLATKLLKDNGATWEDLLVPPAPLAIASDEGRHDAFTTAEMRTAAYWALQQPKHLSPREIDFLLSLDQQNKPPSLNQAKWLRRILTRLGWLPGSSGEAS